MGQPIHRLLGIFRTSVPAYASSAVLSSPEAYAQEVKSRAFPTEDQIYRGKK